MSLREEREKLEKDMKQAYPIGQEVLLKGQPGTVEIHLAADRFQAYGIRIRMADGELRDVDYGYIDLLNPNNSVLKKAGE